MISVPSHVLLIDPQHEKLAASHLTGRGIACYLPLEPAYRTRGHRRRPVKTMVPIFRGYLFVSESYASGIGRSYQCDVRWTDGTIRPVTFTNRGHSPDAMWGIKGLIIKDGKPLVLSSRSMSAIREIERKLQDPGAPFRPGDEVRILSGAFSDQLSQVDACEGEFLMVLINFLGRRVRTRVDIFDVELIDRRG
jgi:transcription antitermination factor NusG